MRKILTILVLCSSLSMYSQSVESVLNTFFAKVDKQTLIADFNISLTDGITQPMTYKGKIQMRGECFNLSMSDMEVAYDGKTLYSYMENVEEITLSTPTREELIESNPILYAKALCKASIMSFSKYEKSENMYIIEFIPNDKSAGVEKFILKLRKSDYMPMAVIVRELRNKSTLLTLSNQKYSTIVPQFSITAAGATINDIR